MDTMYWKFSGDPLVEGRVFAVSSQGKHYLESVSAPLDRVLINVKWVGVTPVFEGIRGERVFLEDAQDTPTKRQVGGTHYTDMVVQPIEFSMKNKLDPMQHTIIKYVSRFRAKNGLQDLEKAKHMLELLIEWEKQNAVQA